MTNGRGPAALAPVEPGSDEPPHLVKHPGRGDEDRTEDRQLDPDDVEDLHGRDLGETRIRIAQALQRGHGGLGHYAPEFVGEGQAEDERDADAEQRFDNAGAQFFQVLEERHAEHAFVVVIAVAARWRRRRGRGTAAAGDGRHGSGRSLGDGGYGSGGRRGRRRVLVRVAVFVSFIGAGAIGGLCLRSVRNGGFAVLRLRDRRHTRRGSFRSLLIFRKCHLRYAFCSVVS